MRLPSGLDLGVQDAVNLVWKLDHDTGQHAAADPALDDTDTADPYRRYRPDHRSARPAHRVLRRLSNRHGHWCRTEFNQILIRPDGEVRWTGTSPHPHHSQNRSLNQ
jgi:hypothetical protein